MDLFKNAASKGYKFLQELDETTPPDKGSTGLEASLEGAADRLFSWAGSAASAASATKASHSPPRRRHSSSEGSTCGDQGAEDAGDEDLAHGGAGEVAAQFDAAPVETVPAAALRSPAKLLEGGASPTPTSPATAHAGPDVMSSLPTAGSTPAEASMPLTNREATPAALTLPTSGRNGAEGPDMPQSRPTHEGVALESLPPLTREHAQEATPSPASILSAPAPPTAGVTPELVTSPAGQCQKEIAAPSSASASLEDAPSLVQAAAADDASEDLFVASEARAQGLQHHYIGDDEESDAEAIEELEEAKDEGGVVGEVEGVAEVPAERTQDAEVAIGDAREVAPARLLQELKAQAEDGHMRSTKITNSSGGSSTRPGEKCKNFAQGLRTRANSFVSVNVSWRASRIV